eukprot:TRINITY_DN3627_c0_g1_i1.p1 TRINITY_DN3627_c0_g1~~TRINITY_DN3627_c0_g1_i1.p1  ORF type:complete len:666 (-),score=177.20 TRINITY_DN3627_c0_g1_i1:952-2880(-)
MKRRREDPDDGDRDNFKKRKMEPLSLLKNKVQNFLTKLDNVNEPTSGQQTDLFGDKFAPRWGVLNVATETKGTRQFGLYKKQTIVGFGAKSDIKLDDRDLDKGIVILEKMDGKCVMTPLQENVLFVNDQCVQAHKSTMIKNSDKINVKEDEEIFELTPRVKVEITQNPFNDNELQGKLRLKPIPETPKAKGKPFERDVEMEEEAKTQSKIELVKSDHMYEEEQKEQLKEALTHLILTPEHNEYSFSDFPHFLDDKIVETLKIYANLFLNVPESQKFFENINSLSRFLLLEGPKGSQIYQEKLVKALAKEFGANVLVVDDTTLDIGPDTDEIDPNTTSYKKGDRVKIIDDDELMEEIFPDGKTLTKPLSGNVLISFTDLGNIGVQLDDNDTPGVDLVNLGKSGSDRFFDSNEVLPLYDADTIAMNALTEIVREREPFIIYFKNVEESIFKKEERYFKFRDEVSKITGRVLVITTSVTEGKKGTPGRGRLSKPTLFEFSVMDNISSRIEVEFKGTDTRVNRLFPTKISLTTPKKHPQLGEWNEMIKDDSSNMKEIENTSLLSTIFKKNNMICHDISSEKLKLKRLSKSGAEKIVGLSLSKHKGDFETDEEGFLIIDPQNVKKAIELVHDSNPKKRNRDCSSQVG